ncbi:MAG TPA: FG-GAP-like repeat-containing protein, partial [Bacteroidia bacterium]|nr:FG-GAP-like repeat-containing protein [Bacteroidia bacterium]
MKRLFHFAPLLFLLFAVTGAGAQSIAGFSRVDSIAVYDGGQLRNPWSGGHNYCQLSEIDLNGDGIKDLFVFDRSGNKITTYINLGTPNQVDYVLAPEYVSRFPLMHDWCLLRDYNCDGKEDIFTCSIAGFAIYKNVST